MNCKRCGDSLKATNLITFCDKCQKSHDFELKQLNQYYYVSQKMIKGVSLLLEGLKETYPGLDSGSHHLQQTPSRVARMFTELCHGLSQDPEAVLTTAFEESQYKGMVASTHIPFTSLCIHHFAIFRGVAHVGYIPNGQVVGLSKLNRLVEILAARPQIQEQLTFQITQAIDKTLKPKGVITIIQGTHDCIAVRGVRSQGSVTSTCEVRGLFLENSKGCKDEFINFVDHNGHKQ